MVVRLAQTLAREDWMALSLDVSNADVAYREGLGESALATQIPSGRRMQAAGRGLGYQKEPCLHVRTVRCFVKHGFRDISPRWKTELHGQMGGGGGAGGRGENCQGPHLIQQDDVGVLKNGAGDGDTLLLPTAQLQSPLAHLRLVPCGYCPLPSGHT